MSENGTFHFTEMDISHYASIVKLWRQAAEIELTIGDTEEAIQGYLARNSGTSFVCLNDKDIVVGTILCGHDGRRGFIYHLFVREEYRKLSIATELLNLGVRALKKEGIKRSIVMVKHMNKDAMDFWDKIGWKKRNDLAMYSSDLNQDIKW